MTREEALELMDIIVQMAKKKPEPDKCPYTDNRCRNKACETCKVEADERKWMKATGVSE